MNEIIGTTKINQHYYIFLFDVSFYLMSLRTSNSMSSWQDMTEVMSSISTSWDGCLSCSSSYS